MLRDCFLGHETKGVRKLGGNCHGRWSVVAMTIFSNVTMWRVHVWEHGGRSRTTAAWKSLRPRHGVSSLIEPTLVAKLKTITLDRLSQRPYMTHQFPVADHRAAPGGCPRGSAVEASATYAVTEFHTCVVLVGDLVGSDPGEELFKSALLAGNEANGKPKGRVRNCAHPRGTNGHLAETAHGVNFSRRIVRARHNNT